MRYLTSIKDGIYRIGTYASEFSKTQAAVGLGAGAGTIYYIGAALEPIISGLPAFTVAIVSGTMVGILTIYGVEKENIKLINVKKLETKEKRKEYLVKYTVYKSFKSKVEAWNNQQIINKKNSEFFSLMRKLLIKCEGSGDIEKKTESQKFNIPRFSTISNIRGSISARPSDPFDNLDFFDYEELPANESETSSSLLSNILTFTKNCNRYQFAVIVSNFAMICYYLEYSMDQFLGMEKWLAWAISVILSIPISPGVVYATATESRTQLKDLENKITFISNRVNALEEATIPFEVSLRELNKVVVDPKITYILENLDLNKKTFSLSEVNQLFAKANKEKGKLVVSPSPSPKEDKSNNLLTQSTSKADSRTPLLNVTPSSHSIQLDDLRGEPSNSNTSSTCLIM